MAASAGCSAHAGSLMRVSLAFFPLILVFAGLAFTDDGRVSFSRTDLEVRGLGPRGIVAEDLNGDEVPDLVIANLGTYKVYQSQTLDVFWGSGDGTFTLAQSIPAGDGNEPYGIASADLRGTGLLDIVVPNKEGKTVSVYLGRDDGTFDDPTSYAAGDAWSVSIGDVDGDGLLDLAVGNFESGSISILLGVGDGTFHVAQTVPMTQGIKPRAVVFGDLDRDGRLDLVVPSDTLDGRLAIFMNKSRPGLVALKEPTIIRVGSGTGAAVVRDLDGDRKLDIVASSISSNHVSVLMGNGDGTFAPPVHYWTGEVWPFGLDLQDLDGDGDPDLIVSGVRGPQISILLGDGRGGFSPPYSAGVEGPSRWVATADFDQDGRLDIAAGNYTSTGGFETEPDLFFKTVSILLNRSLSRKLRPYAFRINCGGPAYVNSRGVTFAADSAFEGGEVVTATATIAQTNDQGLYRSARQGNFAYTGRLAPGRTYTVKLQFAETKMKQRGKRLFNITVNGRPAQTRFDILGYVPRNTAKTLYVRDVWPDQEGRIRIEFSSVRRGALCSAISIF